MVKHGCYVSLFGVARFVAALGNYFHTQAHRCDVRCFANSPGVTTCAKNDLQTLIADYVVGLDALPHAWLDQHPTALTFRCFGLSPLPVPLATL